MERERTIVVLAVAVTAVTLLACLAVLGVGFFGAPRIGSVMPPMSPVTAVPMTSPTPLPSQIEATHIVETAVPRPTAPILETAVPTPEVNKTTSVLDISPDGQWSVTLQTSEQVPPNANEEEQFPNGKYHVEMVVENAAGGKVWTAVGEWRGWGLGLTYPEAVRWSADGRYFYFANVPIPDGCSALVNGGDLWQLDLENGEVQEIAPYIGLVMALSPDETELAVNASYGRGFLIRDLATGEEQSISLPNRKGRWKISGLQWSTNGQYLLLMQVVDPCGPDKTTTAIVRIDRNDYRPQPFLNQMRAILLC